MLRADKAIALGDKEWYPPPTCPHGFEGQPGLRQRSPMPRQELEASHAHL